MAPMLYSGIEIVRPGHSNRSNETDFIKIRSYNESFWLFEKVDK